MYKDLESCQRINKNIFHKLYQCFFRERINELIEMKRA